MVEGDREKGEGDREKGVGGGVEVHILSRGGREVNPHESDVVQEQVYPGVRLHVSEGAPSPYGEEDAARGPGMTSSSTYR